MTNFRLISKQETKIIKDRQEAGIKSIEITCPACKDSKGFCFTCCNTRTIKRSIK